MLGGGLSPLPEVVLLWGPEAHSAQSTECRCLSQFSTQQPKNGACWPRTTLRACPYWSQLRSFKASEGRQLLLSRAGSQVSVPLPAFSHEGNKGPSYCSGVGRSRKDKAVTHLARATHAFRKSLSSTKRLVLSLQ